jgi:integrase
MASIRRKPNSKYWYACFDQADGKRTQVSTKTTDRKKALRIAQEYEESVLEAKMGVLSESSARKHMNKIYELGAGRKIHFHTIKGWLEWWMENKAKTKREGTAKRYEGTVKIFLKVLGDRANLDIRHLSQIDAENFRRFLMESGKANRTINVDIKTVSAAINLAKRSGLIDNNPFASLDSLPVGPSKRKPFDEEQLTKIFKEAKGEWLGVSLFSCYTSMRISNATQLQWRQIELDGDIPLVRFIEYKKQDKHRREIVVPMHSTLMEYIVGLKRGADTDFLFPELQPKKTGGNAGLSRLFRKILVSAGIVEELVQEKEKKKAGSVARRVSPYSFHCLRHTFLTVLANKGVAADIRNVLSGHAKPSVAEAYVHRDTQVLADAVALMPKLKVA